MKKVVIAFDGTNYSTGAVAFAAGLNKLFCGRRHHGPRLSRIYRTPFLNR